MVGSATSNGIIEHKSQHVPHLPKAPWCASELGVPE